MKIQKQLYVLFTLTLIIIIYCFYIARTSKIVCIDMIKVVEKSEEINRIMKEFEKKEKNLQAREDTIILELQNDLKEFEKKGGKSTEQERREFSNRLNEKQNQYSQYKKISQQRMEEQRSMASEKVLIKINRIAADIAKSRNYNIILGATGKGNVIYLEESVDITNEVIKILNNE